MPPRIVAEAVTLSCPAWTASGQRTRGAAAAMLPWLQMRSVRRQSDGQILCLLDEVTGHVQAQVME